MPMKLQKVSRNTPKNSGGEKRIAKSATQLDRKVISSTPDSAPKKAEVKAAMDAAAEGGVQDVGARLALEVLRDQAGLVAGKIGEIDPAIGYCQPVPQPGRRFNRGPDGLQQ
mgnify:CR=1 FL=1